MDGTEPILPGPEIVELRQYRTVPGRRDQLMSLFEREFVAEQERLGMTIFGWYREQDDPNRFTWMRSFPDHASRGSSTDAFYTGNVWLRNRVTANSYLDDSDDVFMLHPAWPGAGPDAPTGSDVDLVIAPIKPETAGQVIPELKAIPALTRPDSGVYLTAQLPNNYPRLPIREDEFVIVITLPHSSTDDTSREVARTLEPWARASIEIRKLEHARST